MQKYEPRLFVLTEYGQIMWVSQAYTQWPNVIRLDSYCIEQKYIDTFVIIRPAYQEVLAILTGILSCMLTIATSG